MLAVLESVFHADSKNQIHFFLAGQVFNPRPVIGGYLKAPFGPLFDFLQIFPERFAISRKKFLEVDSYLSRIF